MPSRKNSLELAVDFKKLQEERVRTYGALNDAYKQYLHDRDFEGYKHEVATATDTFKNISEQILFIRDLIEDEELKGLVSQVQEQEEKKLKVTVDLQLARQRAQDCPPDQEESAGEYVRKLMRDMNEIIGKINVFMEDLRYRHEELQDRHEQDIQS